MHKRAYAKINFGLNVKSRREDGYHELEMVMVPITFWDDIEILRDSFDSFECNKGYVKYNPNNTMIMALNYLKEKYDIKDHFRLRLNKHIPTRAGLAGGSSDGASVIHIINDMYNLNLSDKEILEACEAVGSDVLFCYYQKPALVYGKGDIVKPFKAKLDPYILLVKPKSGVSTKASFENLNLELCDHPDVLKIKESLENGDYKGFIDSIGNSLEESSFRLNKDIKAVKDKLIEEGMDAALMSGSGSTVFGITNDAYILEKAYQNMKKTGYFVRKVKILKDNF